MNFGLQDIIDGTILGTPIEELLPIKYKLVRRFRKDNDVPINRKELLVEAECCVTGERIVGYVCCCESCRTKPYGEVLYDDRPYGLMTADDESFGNVRVYTDTMRFVNR